MRNKKPPAMRVGNKKLYKRTPFGIKIVGVQAKIIIRKEVVNKDG